MPGSRSVRLTFWHRVELHSNRSAIQTSNAKNLAPGLKLTSRCEQAIPKATQVAVAVNVSGVKTSSVDSRTVAPLTENTDPALTVVTVVGGWIYFTTRVAGGELRRVPAP